MRGMNGEEPKIEIFKPFGEAFELTNKILFQPFELRKWLVIGFAAFLSGHFAGVGFNFPSPIGNLQSHRATEQAIPLYLEHWKPWLGVAMVLFALLLFAFVIVLTWLKARGNFIFTDCIVRNRAVIAGPWREYRKEGNSYFLFLLAVVLAVLVLIALMLGSVIGLGLFKRPAGEMVLVTFVGLLVFLFVIWAAIIIFVSVVTYLMVPVMYRRRCRAVEAFRDVAFLVTQNFGSFCLFCLFGVVLVLAVLIIGTIVTCATCCLAALPYVGTVLLLPVFVCLRAFGLLFLRQFGPDYDAWASFVPPEFLPILSGVPPTPPASSTPNPPHEPPLPPVG
jgi:hypothetical protein